MGIASYPDTLLADHPGLPLTENRSGGVPAPWCLMRCLCTADCKTAQPCTPITLSATFNSVRLLAEAPSHSARLHAPLSLMRFAFKYSCCTCECCSALQKAMTPSDFI